MCTAPMASLPGVDGKRGRSGVVGSPMETSALALAAWNSWNYFHFLSRFLSPDDRFLSQGDLRNCVMVPFRRSLFRSRPKWKR